MLKPKLELIKKDGEVLNITSVSSNISWVSSIDTLSVQLEFTISFDNVFITENVEVGDFINFRNGNTLIFYGVVVDKTRDSLNSSKITTYDFGFYLNKSKVIKQFNGINADEAINVLLKDFGVKTNVPKLSTKITGVYYRETVSDILTEILDKVKNETGEVYYFEVTKNTLEIYKKGSRVVTPKFKPADNVAEFNVLEAIGENFQIGNSIINMKNSIQVFNTDTHTVTASTKDESSISKYGLLQEVVTVDNTDVNTSSNIANRKLQELNKVEETLTMQLIGSEEVRAGRSLNVTNEKLGLNGIYTVLSCTHSIVNGIYLMTVHLEKE